MTKFILLSERVGAVFVLFFALLLTVRGGTLKADFGYATPTLDVVPSDWKGAVFIPSMNYPKDLSSESRPWLRHDFEADPLEYALAVFHYATEGNVEVDWRVQDNLVRKWYHMPWLEASFNGREFIHGLTRERNSEPGELGPDQKRVVQNWGIGMYNPAGGYIIGKVWKNPDKPNLDSVRFPEGTVLIKLIFTQATPDEVPSLKGALEWQANINTEDINTSPRAVATVRLIQFDYAVRDSRADKTTGWVFGALVYDGSQKGDTPFDRFVPVGLSWGNDPGITEEMVKSGKAALQETKLNPAAAALVTHYGYAGRMAGPVDAGTSSCISCHQTAQMVPISSLSPPDSIPLADRMKWFENLKPDQPFDVGQIPLDHSLQLTQALRNFYVWTKERVQESVSKEQMKGRWFKAP